MTAAEADFIELDAIFATRLTLVKPVLENCLLMEKYTKSWHSSQNLK